MEICRIPGRVGARKKPLPNKMPFRAISPPAYLGTIRIWAETDTGGVSMTTTISNISNTSIGTKDQSDDAQLKQQPDPTAVTTETDGGRITTTN